MTIMIKKLVNYIFIDSYFCDYWVVKSYLRWFLRIASRIHFLPLIDWLLPGHPLVLQTSDCKLFPWQSAPPFLGEGLAQVRERVWTPPPHVTLQLPQTPQSDQPPLTAKNVKKRFSTSNAPPIIYKKRVTIRSCYLLVCSLLWFSYDSNLKYLDIHWCCKVGTGNYVPGTRLHLLSGKDWCKYVCVFVLHCHRSGYTRPRRPS